MKIIATQIEINRKNWASKVVLSFIIALLGMANSCTPKNNSQEVLAGEMIEKFVNQSTVDMTKYYGEDFAKVFTPDFAGNQASKLLGLTGKFMHREGEMSITEKDGKEYYTQKVVFENCSLVFTVTFDQNEKIIGFVCAELQ